MRTQKDTDPTGQPGSLKWWLHIIIAILSAIMGAVGGVLFLAPFFLKIF